MFVKLNPNQAARWTALADHHGRCRDHYAGTGDLPEAQWHKDAYDFLRHMEKLAEQANTKDASAVCPICDGKGVL